MTSTAPNHPAPKHPETLRAFRTVRRLLGAYLAISLVTMAAIVALAGHPDLVNTAVWIRGGAVAASSVITLVLAAKAAGGSTGAFRRLRIISTAMLVAIVVIIAVPGTFPFWMKAEQALCGALLLGVAAILNGRHLRTLSAATTPAA